MNDTFLKIENITKDYSDKVGYKIHLLEDISFSIEKNQFVSILAPKGSGKTSLLKIIAGLEKPTEGNIVFNDNKIIYIPTKPSSYPWLNVQQNIGFKSKLNDSEISDIIKMVGLKGYEDHFPNDKSEGFRFRISLGRALANRPSLIIIDEPFNNLSSQTREEIYSLLRNVYLNLKISVLLGTTNITESIYLSDRILLMKKNPGKIIDELNVEFDTTREISVLETNEFKDQRNKIEEIFKHKLDRALYHFSV